MKIKKNTFSTLVLELLFPSIANCRKLEIKNRLPLLYRSTKFVSVCKALYEVNNYPVLVLYEETFTFY
jgi:hypothetical protein